MKKIAFIASGHTGSTLPLVKELLANGYHVDLYILCNKRINGMEASDCRFLPKRRGLEEIPNENWPKTKDYLDSDNIRFFSINTMRPFENNQLLHFLVGFVRSFYIREACRYINSQSYELVNIVGRYTVSDIVRYCKYINLKTIVSLHEVCNHLEPSFDNPNKVLSYLFQKKIPIILFSDKSLSDIKKYKNSGNGCFYRMNFGEFESFSIYKARKELNLPEKYILFIGRLTPYKGLRDFYAATKEIITPDYKCVVAGSGYDETLEDISHNPSYIVLNRYLSDADFAELVERCSFVVCPYTSISQSGIPQTVFVFNKPIIATDLDGFREIIKDGNNGLLFRKSNIEELKTKIIDLVTDRCLLNKLVDGVENFDVNFPEYCWKNITLKYIDCFLSGD